MKTKHVTESLENDGELQLIYNKYGKRYLVVLSDRQREFLRLLVPIIGYFGLIKLPTCTTRHNENI